MVYVTIYYHWFPPPSFILSKQKFIYKIYQNSRTLSAFTSYYEKNDLNCICEKVPAD